ncbi:hypothetical protein AVEN_13920-1 [Araneus ventricosus]|uniref:Uncharacterized protein n=1 Tax=Araneus ventricosus TaxID=182803 RepID=A0A4Y2X5N3_ARAVE|nr:hypothetical protein AVEN_13920-1 [Araneus ventricosus]
MVKELTQDDDRDGALCRLVVTGDRESDLRLAGREDGRPIQIDPLGTDMNGSCCERGPRTVQLHLGPAFAREQLDSYVVIGAGNRHLRF